MLVRENIKIRDFLNSKIIISFIMVLISLYGMVHIFLYGQEASYGVSRGLPWGLLIITYTAMVVSSTGLCLISSLGHVWGFRNFEQIGKRAAWLAISALLGGFFAIFWDLGSPFHLHALRLILYYFPPKFASPIWGMTTFYSLYLLFITIEFISLLSKKWKFALIFGLLAFLAGITAHSNLGWLYGVNIARPEWHGPFFPIDFILSALLSGTALIVWIHFFSNKNAAYILKDEKKMQLMKNLGRLIALFIGAMLFFEIWKTIAGISGHIPLEYQSIMTLISGPLSFNFWFFEMLIGYLLPFILLFITRFNSPKITLIASILVIVGILFNKYDIVISGQSVPVFASYYHNNISLISYTPSLSEISLFIGALGVASIIYHIGEKLFYLGEDNE